MNRNLDKFSIFFRCKNIIKSGKSLILHISKKISEIYLILLSYLNQKIGEINLEIYGFDVKKY